MPFSLRKLTKLQLLALCFVTIFALGSFALSKRDWFIPKNLNNKVTTAQKTVAAVREPKKFDYVSQGRLWPQLRPAFQALGDRLEKPGKERMTFVGTMSRASKATKDETVRVVFESADKLRLEEKDGVTIVGNNDLKASKGQLKKEEQDEAESLLFDSVGNFFAGQMQGQALRFLGAGFKSETASYDLYQVYERTVIGKETRQKVKFYYFNSTSQLLDQIRYETERNGKTIKVEVKFSKWQKVNEQNLPGVITRSEDGAPVLTFTLTNAAIGAKSNDGIFDKF